MAQTINVANIRIGMNADGGEFLRGELRSMTATLKQSETPLDKFGEQMKLMDRAFKEGVISAEQFAQSEEFLAKKFGVLTYKMEEQLQAEKKLADQAAKTAEANRALAENASRLATITNASLSPIQRMAKDVKFLDEQFKAGNIDAAVYNAAIDTLAKKHGVAAIYAERAAEANRKLAQAEKEAANYANWVADANKRFAKETEAATAAANKQSIAMNSQASSMRSLQMIAGQYIGIAAGFQAIKKSVLLATELENNAIAFEVMTGSASRANTLLKGFKLLDVQSPLNYGEFARAGQTLMQFGVESTRVSQHLERLAAISLGNRDKFQSLSLAFGQTQAAGRLMGQEVLQMVNAGFNPLREISRTTGISMVELKKRMEDGQISAEMVAKAFQTATSEGGLFHGMNERLSQSMAGQFAKMESEIKAAAISIGTDLMPMLKQVTGMLREGIGGESGGKRGILGFNIKLISDSYASMFAGIGTGIETLSERFSQGDMVFGTGEAISASFNAVLDKHQEIKDAELDREAALIRAANQEGEIAKKKQEQVEQAKKLAEAEMERSRADQGRLNKLKTETEFQKKAFGDLSKLREEYDKLTLGDDEARRQKQSREGYKQIDIERFEGMKKMIDAEKQRKDAMSESAAIEKEMMSDKEKATAEVARLRALFAQLTPEQQAGSMGQANIAKQAQVQQKLSDPATDIAKNITPALKAGSKEAAAFLLSQRTDAAEKAERKKYQDEMLVLARKANELAMTAPRIAGAR